MSPALPSVKTAGLVLAAGLGTRMRSATPKVLHAAAGRPMLAWVLTALKAAHIEPCCVILGPERQAQAELLELDPTLRLAFQEKRRGTGDAAAAAAWSFAGAKPAPYAAGGAVHGEAIQCEQVLIAAGDVPALQAAELTAFLAAFAASGAHCGVLGMRVPTPTGYGRLVTRGDELMSIVEEKDADAATKGIDICNTGVIVAKTDLLFELLGELTPNNAQGEYYLTDIVALTRARGLKAMAYVTDAWRDFAGVNDRAQLATVESFLVARHRAALMVKGVTLHAPETVYIEADVEVGNDSELGPGVVLKAGTRLGVGVRVGAHAVIDGAVVGDFCQVGAGSVLKGGEFSAGERIPPLSVRV